MALLPNNKYPGVCYLCNLYVGVGEGRFEKKLGGWRVKHVGPGSASGITCEMAKKQRDDAVCDDALKSALGEHGQG